MKKWIYKNNIVTILKELADKNYQVSIWLNKNNPNNLIGSFDEAVNMLFCDCIISDLLAGNEIIFDRAVTKAFRELDDAVEMVDEYLSQEEIIHDPLMQIVRDKAAEILKLIEKSDASESTVEILLDESAVGSEYQADRQ